MVRECRSSKGHQGTQKEKKKSQAVLAREQEELTGSSGICVDGSEKAKEVASVNESDIDDNDDEEMENQQNETARVGSTKGCIQRSVVIHRQQMEDRAEIPQRTKNKYYTFRAKLPKSFTQGAMEEEYHALCAVKNAANLAEQNVLSCVAERAMSWLGLSFKKIHGKEISKQACRVNQNQVLETLQSISGSTTSSTATKNVPVAEQTKEQSSSKDLPEIRRSKRLAEASREDEPQRKKSREQAAIADDEDDDENENDDDHYEDEEVSSEEEGSWRKTYQRTQTNTRMQYLSAYFKHLKTFFGGGCTEDEALAHTRNVHKLLDSIDSTSPSIECLLDKQVIWEWADARIERAMAGRTVQKYLVSLEKFLSFIVDDLPSQLPKLSKTSRDFAQRVISACPNYRRSANKIAAERRWKKIEDDDDAISKLCEKALNRRRHAFDENVLGLSNPIPMGSKPLRTPWEKKDERILLRFFSTKPPKDVIRNVCHEVEELQEIVDREGFERVYEKVKSLYKQTQDFLG